MVTLLISLFLSGSLAHGAEQILCPTVVFAAPLTFKFSADEIRLICGDKGKDSQSQVWAAIPPWQARISLTAMLQKRGYHHMTFEEKESVLHVNLGAPTLISKISLVGAPPELDIARKREIIGEKLTPDKLDELQSWLVLELRHLGYACPKVEMASDETTGEVQGKINSGKITTIAKVDSDRVGDIHPEVFRRYDAFHIGDRYDIWNVTLAQQRIIDDGLVLSDHIGTQCSADGADLHQTIEPGLPRLLQIGAGLDTEQGPQFQIATQYSRFDRQGSSWINSLDASFRIQDIKSNLNWYIFNPASAFYLKPSVELKHDTEQTYEYVEFDSGVLPSFRGDDSHRHWEVNVGPTFQSDTNLAGAGPAESQNLFLNESVLLTTHDYEYFKTNPERGTKLSLTNLTSNNAVGSSLTAEQITLSGESLFNVGNFSPPMLILGLRAILGTVLTPNGSGDVGNLPPTLKYYMGGTQDLRGFARQELPQNAGLGAMTEAYLGLEFRFTSFLPWGLQPYIFGDGGALGDEPATLEWPLYWSPGVGIRWASPVGSFRVEGAHGFLYSPLQAANGSLSHWQIYFSYGEEF